MSLDLIVLMLAVIAVVGVLAMILLWPKKGVPVATGRRNDGRVILEKWSEIELEHAGLALTRRIGEAGVESHLSRFAKISGPPPTTPPNP